MIDNSHAPMSFGNVNPGQFQSMVKQIDCTCSYYLSKERPLSISALSRIDDEALEQLIRDNIQGATTNKVVFIWQDGEHTLQGLEFLHKVVGLQKKYQQHGQSIENELQSDGAILTADCCAFLSKNNFLVSLSIDGPKAIHDHFRVTRGSLPTFDKVFNSAKLLLRYGVPFTTLTRVHRFNAGRPAEVYRFLRDEIGSTHIQFIPIVEFRSSEETSLQRWDRRMRPRINDPQSRPGHQDSVVTEWSVDPEEYGLFLSRVFDEWLKQDLGRVWINHFETLLAQHMGKRSQLCLYSESCGKDEQGDYAKRETLPRYCRQCPYICDCWGECPLNRFVRTPEGEPGLNYLCLGLKRYFRHVNPQIDRIVSQVRASQ